MADEDSVRELVKVLSQSRVVISGDVKPELLNGVSLDILASRILDEREKTPDSALIIVDAERIRKIIEAMKVEKVPVPIEVSRPADFKPIAAEYDADYKVSNRPIERTEGTATDFVNYFRSRLRRIKSLIENTRHDAFGLIPNLEVLKSFTAGREVVIVGLVKDKITTKKGNVMVVLEDETAEVKVMFMNGTSQASRELFEKAASIINDEVLAIKGKISGPFVIANEMLWPDVPIRQKKEVEQDFAVAFMSDIHIGSKKFMEKNFSNMVHWINGNAEARYKELAGKIKYIVMAGDVVDGIGIYPGQDRDLAILDIYEQYQELFNYIDAIPDYIHVFVLPGNHDAVQLSEPQPQLTKDLLGDFKKDNVHFLSNPAVVTLSGMDTLVYHGKSLDSMIASIPGLSYAQPEKAMIELLKRRHIAPIYGNDVSTSFVPSKEDNMVIDKVPDIFHMGHVHKNGISNYHGVEIVNSGTWQSRTDYQIKQGHIPTPCLLPIYEMKRHTFTSVNFAGGQ